MDVEGSQSSIPIRPSQCINVPMFNCSAGWCLSQSTAIVQVRTRKKKKIHGRVRGFDCVSCVLSNVAQSVPVDAAVR